MSLQELVSLSGGTVPTNLLYLIHLIDSSLSVLGKKFLHTKSILQGNRQQATGNRQHLTACDGELNPHLNAYRQEAGVLNPLIGRGNTPANKS